jgi:predicted O-methyltransferase YrrM
VIPLVKPKTTDDVFALIEAPVTSVALGAALELGLFWFLEKGPRSAEEIAHEFEIPKGRCSYWLELLRRAGLLEVSDDLYRLSPVSKDSIVDAFSHDSWALLAEETRIGLPVLTDLPGNLSQRGSIWDAMGLSQRRYMTLLIENPDYARRFTRMLFEVHKRLGDVLADHLDLSGVERLMDIGGGSGVVSIALAGRHPELSCVVVDLPNVCEAGREIAEEAGLDDRVTYHAANFVEDELPDGFDMVIECDVNVYADGMMEKVYKSIKPGGRLVVVDHFAPAKGVSPPCRLGWAFEGSLNNPDFSYITAAEVRQKILGAGFEITSEHPLPVTSEVSTRFLEDLSVFEARK